jgi:hypothetical protein
LVGLEILIGNTEAIVAGWTRLGDESHIRFFWGMPRFAAIASGAGTDDILPTMLTTAVAGNYMIQCQLPGLLSTILTGVFIPIKYLKAS